MYTVTCTLVGESIDESSCLFLLGKKCKRRDMENVISKILKMEDEAEKRNEDRENRWQEAEERRERERRDHEDRQTQMMMTMFSNFMGQMSNLLMAQYPMPSFPPTYPHVRYNSSRHSAVPSSNGFMYMCDSI